MIAYKIIPGKGNSPCVEEPPEAVKEWLENMDVGDILIIEKIKMNEKKFAALDEYEGP